MMYVLCSGVTVSDVKAGYLASALMTSRTIGQLYKKYLNTHRNIFVGTNQTSFEMQLKLRQH